MALPTTQKECTTRRIAALISGLWDKVKNAFLLKTSRGAANGVASLDANGKVPSSQLPKIGTSGIENDAITAELVKDNETLPVNISGNADTAYWAMLSGVLAATWYSLGTVGATSGSSAGYSFLIYGGENVGGNADNIWHLTVSNRFSSRKIIYTQLAGERTTDIQFGCTVGANNTITVYMRRPPYSGQMRFVLLTSSNATPSITMVSGEPSGYIAGTERHTPLIEHVTSIPVNPTVGTIYAL